MDRVRELFGSALLKQLNCEVELTPRDPAHTVRHALAGQQPVAAGIGELSPLERSVANDLPRRKRTARGNGCGSRDGPHGGVVYRIVQDDGQLWPAALRHEPTGLAP